MPTIKTRGSASTAFKYRRRSTPKAAKSFSIQSGCARARRRSLFKRSPKRRKAATKPGRWDPRALRLVLEEGGVSGTTVGVAVSGSLSFGGSVPMISIGLASNQLPVSAAKRLWPAPIAAGSRAWIMDHVDQGLIEKLVISGNIPLDKIGKADVELPDEAVKVDVSIIAGVFRPLANLPPVRDAQVNATITGKVARARIVRGVVETQGNRRFNVSDALIEVLDHAPPN